jgi:hypothetical protein
MEHSKRQSKSAKREVLERVETTGRGLSVNVRPDHT